MMADAAGREKSAVVERMARLLCQQFVLLKYPTATADQIAFHFDLERSHWLAIIAAHLAALAAAGLVIVPREPTEAMHAAGNDEMDAMDLQAGPNGNGNAFCEHVWRAMIAVAR